MSTAQSLVIGTRQSRLAVWQAEYVAARLRALYPHLTITLRFIVTHGDRTLDKPLPEIGGKGVFTAELEAALAKADIHLAVHSLKDLPTMSDPAFTLGAIPERASPYDALISGSGARLADLPAGAVIGTSSLRRVAQIKASRPDMQTAMLRGNVPTRIDKALGVDSIYDAIILARAGLERLGLESHLTETLNPEIMLPAPAQGALAVQCRADDSETLNLLSLLDHPPTRLAVEAERAFLQALDSGCRLPVAALAQFRQVDGLNSPNGAILHLTGRVIALDGAQTITIQMQANVPDRQSAEALGMKAAQAAINQGADGLLAAVQEYMQ